MFFESDYALCAPLDVDRSIVQLSTRTFLSGRSLVRDNSPRWNSWYGIISSAIKLKAAINLFCQQYQENGGDLFSEKYWQDIQKLQ